LRSRPGVLRCQARFLVSVMQSVHSSFRSSGHLRLTVAGSMTSPQSDPSGSVDSSSTMWIAVDDRPTVISRDGASSKPGDCAARPVRSVMISSVGRARHRDSRTVVREPVHEGQRPGSLPDSDLHCRGSRCRECCVPRLLTSDLDCYEVPLVIRRCRVVDRGHGTSGGHRCADLLHPVRIPHRRIEPLVH